MTTLSTIRTTCRQSLADLNPAAYMFSDSQVTGWVQAAIRDLSNYVPRQASAEIIASAGIDSPASLPAGFLAVLSVKRSQPAPAVFLLRRPVTHPGFPYVDGYYDVHQDGTAASLYLSGSTAGQSVVVAYNAEHAVPSNEADVLTIAGRHEPLVALFVRWKAWEAVTTTESSAAKSATAGTSAVVALHMGGAEYERATAQAGEAYRAAVAEAQAALTASAITSGWLMDKYDRR
jgi:hypothetical protein